MSLFPNKPLMRLSPEELRRKKREKRRLKKLDEEEARGFDEAERKKQLQAAKRKRKFEFQSSQKLQASSETLLKELMAEYKITTRGRNIFAAVVKAKLGKKFSLEKRRNKLRVMAAGCAVYHAICKQKSSEKALQKFAASVGVNIERISNPCRIIVESLVDYGDSQEEKTGNRQYAARDARALSYVVRKGMEPQGVLKPAKGENITEWADREAAYRSGQKPAAKRAQKAAVAAISTPEAPDELAVAQLPQALYAAIKGLLERKVVVIAPKAGGKALALAVAPLKGLTADQAKARPEKVHFAIRKALKKAFSKSAEKSSKPLASNKLPELSKFPRDGIDTPSRSPERALQDEW